jgi:hypothetical protein
MFQLVAPQSMKTGCACSYNTGLALALKVSVEQSTSSPGCTPTKRNARWIAAVPDTRAAAWDTPMYSAISRSNAST